MVTLFITPGCTSCRKARKWLEENNVLYKERNIDAVPLSKGEFKAILEMTEFGTEEIISVRSKALRELNLEVELLTLQELHRIIEQHPSILRRPILIDSKNIQVGYNDEAIRRFLPRSARNFEIRKLLELMNE